MYDVKLSDGTIYEVKNLLGKPNSNTKLAKSQSGKYRTIGLSLAPHTSSNFNVCPFATKGCKQSCIYYSGLAQVFGNNIFKARVAKTILFKTNFSEFQKLIIKEINNNLWAAHANKQKLAIRMNMFSDIAWEKIWPTLFSSFPQVQFYDYTKQPNRVFKFLLNQESNQSYFPDNYHLTFSRSEKNGEDCAKILDFGGNVAVVFRTSNFPETYMGFRVISGDDTDLRFLNKSPRIIGLKAKGVGKKDKTGFVVD